MYHSRKSISGSALVVVVVVLAITTLLSLFKPKILDGDSRRADASKQASTQVETGAQKALDAEREKGAEAAASVQSISNAVGDLPPSRATDFVRREIAVPLSLLPKPNYQALLEAERRRAAVMEGKLQLIESLYRDESSKTAKLLEDSNRTAAALQKAFVERRAVDSELAEVAAARLAAERQRNAFFLAAVAAVALWLFSKFYSVSPSSIGSIIADIRNGVDATTAFDTHTSPLLHKHIARATKLAL